MAFDQTTRNRLAKFVGDARTLLTEEFTRQLQHEYGLDPAGGTVTDLDRLTALDDAHRETARILRETMDYYLAGKQANASSHHDVLDRIVREQAFTVLNRLCALRMAEGRGLLIESVGRGYQSKGFQLYDRLAGPALGETGEAYRSYLFSIFDEFAVDLPALFDRFSPQGRLFPREAALLKLLELINDPEIDSLWAEDETIGWIYQYFNSKEERQQMRAESSAPRNSRELAVRNQFFTPRYVVEFLTDNTLGRIWYEMTKGETALKETCHYLVRRPNEIFLDEGQEAPDQDQVDENLSQEELLRQPVFTPHRTFKDPREIKILDPACGSMHFGLYAFDLFEQIYAESWELEERLGQDALWRMADLDSLHNTYPDKEAFLQDVPRLIIECNIHGIDIDPRAVQIAGLSLWLRAQKSWQALGIKANERPQIKKSNVVCAEPMPGDREMLEEFLATLREDRLEALIQKVLNLPVRRRMRSTKSMADALANLVRVVWQEMELAGEAGSLLKIEETLRDAIAQARKASQEKAPLFRVLEYSMEHQAGEREGQSSDAGDDDFWSHAEALVLGALQEYTEQAENGAGYLRRLFAEDVLQGFAFISLCGKRYEVVVMNPPFGSSPPQLEKINADDKYLNAISKNLAWGFVDRTQTLLLPTGMLGAIVDRTIFQKSSYEEFRVNIISNFWISEYLDLGYGVLDEADVMTSAFTCLPQIFTKPTIFLDLRQISAEGKSGEIYEAISSRLSKTLCRFYYRTTSELTDIPFASFAYWLPKEAIYSIFKQHTIGELGYKVGGGLQCNDVFRFVRIYPEIPPPQLTSEQWVPFYNGGPFSGYWLQNYQYVLWTGKGCDIKSKIIYEMGDHPSRYVANEQMYFMPGIAGGKRGEYFDVHVLPPDMIFSNEGRAFQSDILLNTCFLLAYLNNPICQNLVNVYCGQHKGSDYLRRIPIPHTLLDHKERLANLATKLAHIKRAWSSLDEVSLDYVMPSGVFASSMASDLSSLIQQLSRTLKNNNARYKQIENEINEIIQNSFGSQMAEELSDLGWTESPRPNDRIELAVSLLDELFAGNQFSINIISYAIGVVYGRWDVRFAVGQKQPNEQFDLYAAPPICPPGMLEIPDGLSDNEIFHANYPVTVAWRGILVNDPGHQYDIEDRVIEVFKLIWGSNYEITVQEITRNIGLGSIIEFINSPHGFFANHLKHYRKSRRSAPIYWPLSTPSNSYTLWLYYHRIDDQILFTCVNDFVDPKLKQVSEESARLRQKPNRNAKEEKELELLIDFEGELKGFREELLRLATFWKPNLNDGVQITAAPLWKLFQYKPWQKKLKKTWEKLEAGDYDWAHLAYSIWPERVREKCKTDKSLAIAHDLEHLYVEPKTSRRKRGRSRRSRR